MIAIDASHVKGERGTGYEPPNGKGPFQCSNCEYFNGSTCGQSTMMEHSQLPKDAAGRVKVDPAGCCEYVDRVGKAPKQGRSYFRRKIQSS